MRVVIESPFRSVDKSTKTLYTTYSRRAVEHSLAQGESPIAFHLWFTRYLNDDTKDQREQGLKLSLEWIDTAQLIAVYADYGISEGMILGIQHASQKGIPIQWRYLFRRSKSK